MRDYVCDEQNRVVAIHFDRVEPEEERSLAVWKGLCRIFRQPQKSGAGNAAEKIQEKLRDGALR